MRTAIVLLLVWASAATYVAYHQKRELGYCVQLLDPNVTVVPVE